MKNLQHIASLKIWILAITATFLLVGCEDVIDLETETGPAQVVVDGWITNQPGPQKIKLTWSSSYFDNGTPKPVLGAEVIVTDDKGVIYKFEDAAANGEYTWAKTATDTLGHIGRTYSLKITNGTEVYTATTELKPVPKVDSVVYTKEKLPFKPEKGPQEGYIAEFYARDLPGVGNTYWIKPLIKGKPVVDKAANISIAYDAAFGSGAPSDGLIFILPIRQSITTDTLYSAGASIGVELHSITNATFEYLKQIQEQAQNGGLFATPIQNVKSNVVNADPNGKAALGFFAASAVSRNETIIDPEKARPDDN